MKKVAERSNKRMKKVAEISNKGMKKALRVKSPHLQFHMLRWEAGGTKSNLL